MNTPIPASYYKEIVEAVNDALMVVGHDGTILIVNKAMEILSGYSRSELIGAPCNILKCDACEVILSEDREKWCMLIDSGGIRGRRCLMMKKDGSYVTVLENASLLKNTDGTLLGALETFADVSEIDKKDQEVLQISKVLDEVEGFHGMVGKSVSMERIYQVIERSAESDAPVTICGESGTGKELVAHAIHNLGRRREGPFIQYNCAALNEALLESELFGHVRGAFTGAYRHRIGRFEAARGGDIFLDEISEIPLSSQAKLLRVLETKQFERVGDHRSIVADVRIITATNRNLEALVSEGTFRKDLFFRINVLPIYLPPLRGRKQDIPLLVTAFIRQIGNRSGKDLTGVSAEVLNLFMAYPWPGNIRELKSTLEYAAVIAESGLIQRRHLPGYFGAGTGVEIRGLELEDRKERLRHLNEKAAIVEALRLSNGNRSEAAKLLGVHRMTIWNRMKKYGIQEENAF